MTVAENNNEREFYVKEIPERFTDWDLFRVFLKYGPVDNVRIPLSQNSGQTKYGFVTMLNLNGSDEVRKNINKRKLVVSDNISISVSDIRVNANDRTNTKKSDRVLAPISQNVTPFSKPKQVEEDKGRKGSARIPYRDLPVGDVIKAKIVPSPYKNSEDFIFHLVELGAAKKNYETLNENLTLFCSTNPACKNGNEIKVGSFLVYSHEKSCYRAERISETEVYLIDSGVVVPFSFKKAWRMPPYASNLPALVVPCTIANVNWVTTTPEALTTTRNVLAQWCSMHGEVHVQNIGFKQSLNVVKIMENLNTQDELIESLVKKGYCSLNSEEQNVKTYTRAELFSLKTLIEKDKNYEITNISEQFKKLGMSEIFTA